MSKRGSRSLRWALFMAANSGRQCCPYLKNIYEKQMKKGKHHYVALSHVMRKQVHIAVSVLKNKKPFDPEMLPNFSLESA